MVECQECGLGAADPEEHNCKACGLHIAGAPEYLSDRDQVLAVVSQHDDGCPEAEALLRALPIDPLHRSCS